jgi:hypothetical protein
VASAEPALKENLHCGRRRKGRDQDTNCTFDTPSEERKCTLNTPSEERKEGKDRENRRGKRAVQKASSTVYDGELDIVLTL